MFGKAVSRAGAPVRAGKSMVYQKNETGIYVNYPE